MALRLDPEPSACLSARAKASICRAWSFSGLNWPMERMIGFFRFLAPDLRGISVSSSVLHGGKTVEGEGAVGSCYHQNLRQKMSRTWPLVQLEFVTQTCAKLPTQP